MIRRMNKVARNVFISFRFSDGEEYKKDLCELFDQSEDVVNCSEDEDRSNMTEETIREYLYAKLKRTSVTLVLLTPNAIEYRKNWLGYYDDWLYDELRYSLEDRGDNRTNGVVAIYTEDAKDLLIEESTHRCNKCNRDKPVSIIKNIENLARKNMMNIKSEYKMNPCDNVYDRLEDSYVTWVSFDEFTSDINKYIINAIDKRERKSEFDLVKRM